MTCASDWDRKQRLAMKWHCLEVCLRRYSGHSTPSALPCFKYREGWFVVTRTVLLIVLLVGALYFESLTARIILGGGALYFLVDALLVNTSYIFISGLAVSPLRSVLLTMGTYFDMALCFAVPWPWLVRDDKGCAWWERATTATYESLRTLATVGPENSPDWWIGRYL